MTTSSSHDIIGAKMYIMRTLNSLTDPSIDVNTKFGMIEQLNVILADSDILMNPIIKSLYPCFMDMLPIQVLYEPIIYFYTKTCIYNIELQNILFHNGIFDYIKDNNSLGTDHFIFALCYLNNYTSKYFFQNVKRPYQSMVMRNLKKWYMTEGKLFDNLFF